MSVSNGDSQSYNWLDQTGSITPNGGSAINATFSGGGQSERLSNGSTNYQYDGTGLSTSTDGYGNRTAFTNTPDGDVVSENAPIGLPGCTGAGGAIFSPPLLTRRSQSDHGLGGDQRHRA